AGPGTRVGAWVFTRSTAGGDGSCTCNAVTRSETTRAFRQAEDQTIGFPMLTIRAMSDGKGYSSRHLDHSDYYAEGERVTGVWHGRGAELLGLSGPVETEEFEALRQGLDPETH